MKTILSLDQHEMGLIDPNDQEISWTRRAARAVLRNDQNQIAVMRFAKTGVCKLAGGGMDEGEEIEMALRREVREEAGYEITDIKELGVVEEDRYASGMHQISYCSTAKVTNFIGTELTEKEAAAGMELIWCESIDDATQAIRTGQANAIADEDGDRTGLVLMTERDCAILAAAK